MNFFERMFHSETPRDLTPSQLQVLLQEEKSEAFIIFMICITVGAVLAGLWPSFATLYTSYGGFALAALGMAYGANIAHKAISKGSTDPQEISEEVNVDEPKTPKT